MRSEAECKERYSRGVQNGAALWNARKGQMAANWAGSIGAGPTRAAKYQQALGQAQYKPGDPNKWWNNWRAAMSI